MDELQNVVLFIVLLLFLYTPSKHAAHMFQQNHYQGIRYLHWLWKEIGCEKKKIAMRMGCLMATYGLFFVAKENVPITLLILLLMIYTYVFMRMEDRLQYRKPLIFTHRMQRLLLACYLCYAILLCLLMHVCILPVWIAIVPFLYFMPWILLLMVAYAIQPLEKQIQRFYMQDAKRQLRLQSKLCIVGITGSYGKTSIKTILCAVLCESYYTLMTPQSYNNRMGITVTIRTQLQKLHEIFLCEMGADHVHEIEQLMRFVAPTYGVVTAIGPQHIATFHSIEAIIHEKMQMIERLPADGIGFLNMDDANIRSYSIQNNCSLIYYGMCEDADYRVMHVQYTRRGSTFCILHEDKQYLFSTKLLGRHNVINIVGAIAIAHTFGVAWEILQQRIEVLDYVEHRLQLRQYRRYTILDNAYNSNPTGAQVALEVLSQMAGKHIIITPGFLDMGSEEKKAHVRLGKEIAQCVDEAILVGKNQTRDIVDGLRLQQFPFKHIHVVNGIEEAFALLATLADPQTTVLLENDLPDAFNH